jgi:tRNA (guanine37-N1)-methyltransferase
MMRFDIMTLFPDLVDTVLGKSIIGRAQKSGAIAVRTHNIRDYSEDKHRRVDDTPYGGGKGMLMMAPPIYNCYRAILDRQTDEGLTDLRRRVIYMSPTGKVLTQARAAELARDYDNLIILCGHYEGVDRRIVDEIVDEEISIGDFVLTGGEIPACILTDCVARLVDGVLSDAECHEKESISSGLLEYPQYTRPYEFHGVKVPDVLISGHHANIDRWREEQALEMTERLRPDLLDNN